jgi:D-3-phosphoglycerate dehydrogenase / 2-oxoglutarate reductase
MTGSSSTPLPETPLVLALDTVGEDVRAEEEILVASGIGIQLASRDPAELERQFASAQGLLTEYVRVDERLLQRTPSCRAIVTYTVGIDQIDVEAARSRGVVVCNLPDYCTEEVADHAMALILGLSRGVVRADSSVRSGAWGLEDLGSIHRLRGLTLGLVGFGRIARAVAARASAFGLRIVAFDPGIPVDRRPAGPAFTEDLADLLAQADIISLHAPLSTTTTGMIDGDALAGLKPGALLVNTSRGGLVVLAALLDALDRGILRGAALDVFPEEPPDIDPLNRPELILTPHMSYYSIEAVQQAKVAAATAIAAALTGNTPMNRIA